MEKRSGRAPEAAHKCNCKQTKDLRDPQIGVGEGENKNERPSGSRESPPASATGSRENGDYPRSQELDSEGDASRKSRRGGRLGG